MICRIGNGHKDLVGQEFFSNIFEQPLKHKTWNLKQKNLMAALRNGTVIDHIPSSRLFKAVDLLGIEKLG